MATGQWKVMPDKVFPQWVSTCQFCGREFAGLLHRCPTEHEKQIREMAEHAASLDINLRRMLRDCEMHLHEDRKGYQDGCASCMARRVLGMSDWDGALPNPP